MVNIKLTNENAPLLCQRAMIKTANTQDENAPGYIVFYCGVLREYHPVLPSLLPSVITSRALEGLCSHCVYWKERKDAGH